MRNWLLFGAVAAFAASMAGGCGSGGGGNGGGFDSDASGGSSSGSSGASSSGGSSGASGSSSGGFGDDATASSSSSGMSGLDSSLLDISFPDAFVHPDGSSGGSGSGSSSGGGDAGCAPNGITCQGNVAYTCSNGTLTQTTCASPKVCANGYGCVTCVPGTGSCNGNVGTSCNNAGTGTVTNNCDPVQGETCNAATGTCSGDCANLGTSYQGCEYYAVTMANSALDQSTFYASVSLSNASTKTASISIQGPNGTNVSDTIAAGQLKEYHLPWVSSLSTSTSTSLVAGGAYHIRSNEPLSAYQFNARDYVINGVYSYTNDASLLIPTNALTGNYRVVSAGTWLFSGATNYPGTVVIIGTEAGTSVTYAAPSGNPIQAGGGLATTGGTVTLNAGDVMQIGSALNASASAFGSDQTGALITATKPVMVFGGSDCTYMPATVPACDHIEEINFPIETLRTDYLVTLPNNSNGTPQQYVKIVGTQNGTTLTYDPQPGGAATTLNAGQVTFFQTTKHFHVTASQPIIIGQYMESENNFSQTATSGDPALSTAVATAQFRTSYQFVAPANYAQNWVNVIAPTGATVQVDGANVTGFTPIGSASGYSVAYVSLCANSTCTGVHTATSSSPFGIEVYGYGSYTSYMYPGGLNLYRN